MGDRCGDVGLDAGLRRLPDVLHVVEVVIALGCPCRTPEVVARDRMDAALGEPERELLVEAGETAHVREQNDADAVRSIRDSPEGCEAISIRGLENQVLVRDGCTRDPRDGRLGIGLEAHVR